MKKTNDGSAIIIGIFLLVILTLTMYILLDYMVPFARQTNGIENSSKSYYQAYSGIEDSLLALKNSSSLGKTMNNSKNQDYSFTGTIEGNVIPYSGKGNSNDRDYNKISMGNPIQINIGHGVHTLNLRLCVKVPNLEDTSIINYVGSGDVIYWSLTGKDVGGKTIVLNGKDLLDDSYIQDSNYDCSNNYSSTFAIGTKKGKTLDGAEYTFAGFYSNCDSGCELRLSLISPISVKKGMGASYKIPYLEYQFHSTENIQLYYTTIEAIGKSYGFQKDLEVQIPRKTLNQAFDFTVFQ